MAQIKKAKIGKLLPMTGNETICEIHLEEKLIYFSKILITVTIKSIGNIIDNDEINKIVNNNRENFFEGRLVPTGHNKGEVSITKVWE